MDLFLLGPVEARSGGRPVPLGPRQQRLILAVLALEANRLVPIEQLIDIVWPVSPPRTAANAVQVCVSRLRRVLAGPVTGDGGVELVGLGAGYVLRTDPMRVDAHRFRALVKQARSAPDKATTVGLLEDALGLWSGPALADVVDGEVRDQLCRGLEEARLLAMEDVLDIRLEWGEHRDLVGTLTDLAAAHPLRERLIGQLMLVLHRSGRSVDALELFRSTKDRMARETGLDLSPSLRRLQVLILRADPELDLAPAAAIASAAATASEPATGARTPVEHPATEPAQAPPAQLPPAQLPPAQLPPAVALVGRTRELALLHEALDETRAASGPLLILAIDGPAGVGKTALAIHWAYEVAARFPDGQLHVDLRGFAPAGEQPMTADEAVRHFLEALGVATDRIPATLDARVSAYRTLLAGRRVLVVLDNAATADQVRPLLPGAATCAVVVTSRNQLVGLVAGEGAHLTTLDVLGDDEAHELLVRRMGRARVVEQGDHAALREIIATCGGLPLALAVAAARAASQPGFSLADLAAALRRADGGLDEFAGPDPVTDVRAVFSWTYRLLGEGAARAFRTLAIHPGPDVTHAVAASLLGEEPEHVVADLAELTRAHLLHEHRPGRYRFHDLVRAYAMELALAHDAPAARHAVVHRLLDHYLHTAHAADRTLNPFAKPRQLAAVQPGVSVETFTEHDTAAAWFGVEQVAMIAVIGLAGRDGFDEYVGWLARTLVVALELRGEWQTLANVQADAVEAARRIGDAQAEALANRVLGRAYTQLGQYDRASTHHARAVELFERLGDLTAQGHVLIDISWLYSQQQRHSEALPHARRAIDVFRSAQNRFGEALALNAAGHSLGRLGDHPAALAHCEQALTTFQEYGARDAEADTWDSIGYSHQQAGDTSRAVRCFEMALAAYRVIGDRYHEGDTLDHLGDAHHAAGDHALARELWTQAAELLADLRHPDADRVRRKLPSCRHQ